jgi:hypothetical protein
MERGNPRSEDATVGIEITGLAPDAEPLHLRIHRPVPPDNIWTAELFDGGSAPPISVVEGWVARFPQSIRRTTGLRDHLRILQFRVRRRQLRTGAMRELLGVLERHFHLPVEPERMNEIVERFSRWEWLSHNRATLDAHALLK